VTYFGMEGLGAWWAEPFMGTPTSVRGGGLTRCQSDHDDYVCSCERVAMSGDEGMKSST
jgi:hypothetical protein